jgi:hypothetical protein
VQRSAKLVIASIARGAHQHQTSMCNMQACRMQATHMQHAVTATGGGCF